MLNIKAINTKDFILSSKLAIADSNSIEDLNEIKQNVDKLRNDANYLWEKADEINLKNIIKSGKIEKLFDSSKIFQIGLESSVFYIPEMDIIGPADARKNLSSWMSELMGIQTKITSRINSLSLKQESSVTELEVSNGGASHRLMFFLTNDANVHGNIYLEQARTTKDIAGLLEVMKRLESYLWGFQKDENDIKYNNGSTATMKANNMARWSMIIKSCISILEGRASNPEVEE